MLVDYVKRSTRYMFLSILSTVLLSYPAIYWYGATFTLWDMYMRNKSKTNLEHLESHYPLHRAREIYNKL